jgi:hypothetical protein
VAGNRDRSDGLTMNRWPHYDSIAVQHFQFITDAPEGNGCAEAVAGFSTDFGDPCIPAGNAAGSIPPGGDYSPGCVVNGARTTENMPVGTFHTTRTHSHLVSTA